MKNEDRMPGVSQRRWWPVALLATSLAVTACSESTDPAANPTPAVPDAPEEQEQRRPNLLIIAVDTLRADHLGAYGYEQPTSPAVDRLLARAVVFEDAHSTAPWTLPSFASLMTSRYTSAHKCWNFRSKLDDSFVTLAETLRDNGYDTAAVVSHTFLGTKYGLAQGFAHYDESLVFAHEESHKAISSPPVTEKAVALLDKLTADADKPWFLWVHYFDPHTQYNEHEGITKKFGKGRVGRYDGEIAFTDAHIGTLLDRLAERDPEGNTVIAFVADHGEEFREHGRFGHGQTLFHEVVRVPFAIVAPGVAPQRVADPVSVVDFVPTVLPLLGLPATDPGMAGRNLLAGSAGEREILLESRLFTRRKARLESLIHGRWKLIVEAPKRQRAPGKTRFLLFDRDADPRDRRNVAKEHPQVVEQMRKRLRAAVERAGKATAAAGAPGEVKISPEELEALKALGYVGNSEEEAEAAKAEAAKAKAKAKTKAKAKRGGK